MSADERLFRPHLHTWYKDHPEYAANPAEFIRKRMPIDVPILKKIWERQGGKSAIGGRAISLNTGVTNAYSALATPRHVPVRASIDHKIPRHLYRSGQVPLEELYNLEKNAQWISTFQNQHKNGFREEDLQRDAADSRRYHELQAQVAEGAEEYQQHSKHFLKKLGKRLRYALGTSQAKDRMTFEAALNQMRSANQKSFKDVIRKATEALGIKPHLENAIGDWSDGAEHSVLQRIHEPIDERTADYLAAWYGLLANQKAVLVFQPRHGGPDSNYEVDVPDSDLNRVREHLNQAGIPFRTIVPTGKGARVWVYDQGNKLKENVGQFAEKYNAEVRESQGHGKFLGGNSGSTGANTRSEARSNYRRIITAYESRSKSGSPQAPVPTNEPSRNNDNLRPESSPAPQEPVEPPAREKLARKKYARSGTVAAFERLRDSLKRSDPRNVRKRKWEQRDRRARELQSAPAPVKESREQSPEGGMIVRGIYYPGGEMIPSKDYSAEQKARYARGDVAGALKAEADRKARVKYSSVEQTGQGEGGKREMHDFSRHTAAQLHKEQAKVSAESEKLTNEMIEGGRGHERPSDYQHKTDALSVRLNANQDKQLALNYEANRRGFAYVHNMPLKGKSRR